MGAVAGRAALLAGVVGWVDLARLNCEAQLEEFKDNPHFVGIQHLVQIEPDDFIVRDEILRGLAVLEKHEVAYDLLFFVPQLKHAATIARTFPNLRLVIDHLAKPYIKPGKIDGCNRISWKRRTTQTSTASYRA